MTKIKPHLVRFRQCIEQHIVSKDIQHVASPPHLLINPNRPLHIPAPQISLQQALVSIPIKPQPPLPLQLQALLDLPRPHNPNQYIQRRDVPPNPIPLHLLHDLHNVIRIHLIRFRQDREETVVSEAVVLESGEGSAEVEEGEGLVRGG